MCLFVCLCVQIVGNGSEQQLQQELEDVLMDPSVTELVGGPAHLGGADHGHPTTAVPPRSSPKPPKLEIVLPVQGAQESELNERSYRGKNKKNHCVLCVCVCMYKYVCVCIYIYIYIYIYIFTFMHLADYIQAIHIFFISMCVPWELNPWRFAQKCADYIV